MRIIEKNLLEKITYRFFRTIVWRKSNEDYSTNNFVTLIDLRFIKADNSELQEQWSFNLQPKQTIICEAQAKKAELVF